ncbi:hypothetical protein GJ744_006311 [Endocarpon pusillum]|uniref:Enoyl reductase (ER) domain-containing protein n=1 Tax=Endocarpon pusillum TaxID=364733 RepID=A0A8H7AJX7_9EURO|nr:hypothetical protein GJ744_006311 [Endocarpon pusillum]
MSSIVNEIKHKVSSVIEVTHRPHPPPQVPNELLFEGEIHRTQPNRPFTARPGFFIASYPSIPGSDSAPDYDALPTRDLVPAVNAVELPEGMTFNEASLLRMAVVIAWSGWYTIGLPRDTSYTATDKQGMLVWGGASSIGSAAIQVAKMMGSKVYTTASEKHHEYLNELGASKMFDYREGEKTAKLASATHILEDTPKVEGVEAKFVAAPLDERERTEFFHFVFRVWLKERLEKGEFVPSPRIQVVERGLQSAQKALHILKKGVSGVKLVLEV